MNSYRINEGANGNVINFIESYLFDDGYGGNPNANDAEAIENRKNIARLDELFHLLKDNKDFMEFYELQNEMFPKVVEIL